MNANLPDSLGSVPQPSLPAAYDCPPRTDHFWMRNDEWRIRIIHHSYSLPRRPPGDLDLPALVLEHGCDPALGAQL